MRLPWLRTLVAMCAILGALLATSARGGDLLWGVNGHPLASCPGVMLEQQIGLVSKLNASSYRVDVTRVASMTGLAVLVRVAKAHGITILAVLIPPLNLDSESPTELRLKSAQYGEDGQASGLAEKMAQLRKLARLYNVEAAYAYELLDETYWAPDFEAFMGLVRLERAPNGVSWALGRPKAAFCAYRDAIAAK